MGDLRGKVAVVTGASRGLGQRIALRLGQHGAAVALLSRSEAGLQTTRRQIESMGARTLVMPVDLSKPDSVEHLKAVIERDLGVPSILINAAGNPQSCLTIRFASAVSAV
jgi:short-subunit dehydrogenase